MYTQCPECHARFRVGAGDLSAAGGTVRCGRCGDAFNALARLSDSVPPALDYTVEGSRPGEDVVLETSQGLVTGVEFHFTADDIESVFAEPGSWRGRTEPSKRGSDAAESYASGAEPPIVVVSENRPFEDITLEGERISIESILGIAAEEDDTTDDGSPTDEFEVLQDVPDSAYPEDDESPADVAFEVASRTAIEAAPDAAASTGDKFEAAPASGPGLEELLDAATSPAPSPGEALDGEPSLAAVLEPQSAPSRPSRSSLAWSFGCLLVALALLAQVTHQYRQDLVRHPQIGPWLEDIYARIGLPLAPNWDLDAFQLRQWGNSGDPDANGSLTVRASLTNRATFAQPHPILRLELDDRFGDSVAVRDFEPAEYLKNPSEAARLLGPGASAEAELVIVDPGKDAVGYQLDVCLRESATILRCAQGPG
jgi:predicted Zn finger-like uncharacterized protein